MEFRDTKSSPGRYTIVFQTEETEAVAAAFTEQLEQDVQTGLCTLNERHARLSLAVGIKTVNTDQPNYLIDTLEEFHFRTSEALTKLGHLDMPAHQKSCIAERFFLGATALRLAEELREKYQPDAEVTDDISIDFSNLTPEHFLPKPNSDQDSA
jgi:hypothetical protein